MGTAWSPVLTIKSALLSLQSLLSDPQPNDPQDAEVARMLKTEPEKFQQKAREWAVMHAGAPQAVKWSGAGTSSTSQNVQRQDQSEEEREREELAK